MLTSVAEAVLPAVCTHKLQILQWQIHISSLSVLNDFFSFFFQIPCADLHEVIDALVEKTAGTLQPFLLEEPYEENISEATIFCSYSFFALLCNNAKLPCSVCFGQWWEWRKDPAHRPLQPPAKGTRPASKTRLVPASQSACTQLFVDLVHNRCCHSGVDRWPGSPLSRSPAPDRRILSSSVPASPTNPMRRLIHSPSPLAQSEYAVQIPSPTVILTNQLSGLVVVSALRLMLGTQH